jgi:hypothetical protein
VQATVPDRRMGGTTSRIRMARCLLPRAPDHLLISEVPTIRAVHHSDRDWVIVETSVLKLWSLPGWRHVAPALGVS